MGLDARIPDFVANPEAKTPCTILIGAFVN